LYDRPLAYHRVTFFAHTIFSDFAVYFGWCAAVCRYFLRRLKKVKSAVGEIMEVKEIAEKRPGTIKNYGIA
jgi:hypothetical protein